VSGFSGGDGRAIGIRRNLYHGIARIRWRPVQFDAATGDCLLYRLGEVVPQVPAISHLDRAGCAAADGFGIRTGPIPADDLDPGMLAQPVGEGVCSPIRQQLDRSVGVDIDDDRPVDMPTAQREVVHAERRHHTDCAIRQRPHQSQQGVAGGAQPEPVGQPRPRPARQGQPDSRQHRVQQLAAPTIARRQPVHLLGERRTRTAGFRTPEPANPQSDPHRLAADRGVGQPAFIAAVHPLRALPALRTGRAARAWTRPNLNRPGHPHDPVDHHRRQMRQQHLAPLELTFRT